jgi:hypothetical protein
MGEPPFKLIRPVGGTVSATPLKQLCKDVSELTIGRIDEGQN